MMSDSQFQFDQFDLPDRYLESRMSLVTEDVRRRRIYGQDVDCGYDKKYSTGRGDKIKDKQDGTAGTA